MKKLLLISALFISFLGNAQSLSIDSLSNDTAWNGRKIKIYLSSTGSWSPSYNLTLRFNSVAIETLTYQNLVDSGFVITLTIPYCSTVNSNYPINIYNAVKYVWIITQPVGIEEYFIGKGEVDKYFYYDLGNYSLKINLRTKEKFLSTNASQ